MIAHPASLVKSSNEKIAKKSLVFQHLYNQTFKNKFLINYLSKNRLSEKNYIVRWKNYLSFWKQKALIFKKLALILSPDDFEGVGSHFSVPSLPSSSRLSCPEGKGTKNVLNRAESVASASREPTQLGGSPGRFCYCWHSR